MPSKKSTKKKKTKKSKIKKSEGKKLYRSRDNKIIVGICSGMGRYADIDPTVIRIIWILFLLLSFGTGILLYLIAWVIIPKEPEK